MNDTFVRLMVGAITITMTGFTLYWTPRMLCHWFMCAWEKRAATYYIQALTWYARLSNIYVFSITGYFNSARYELMVCFVVSILSAIAVIVMLIVWAPVKVFYLLLVIEMLLVAFTSFDFAVHLLCKGTDGRRYTIYDRYAPLNSKLKRRIRKELKERRFTFLLGMFQTEYFHESFYRSRL